jgi:hypothetical protein
VSISDVTKLALALWVTGEFVGWMCSPPFFVIAYQFLTSRLTSAFEKTYSAPLSFFSFAIFLFFVAFSLPLYLNNFAIESSGIISGKRTIGTKWCTFFGLWILLANTFF